MFLLLFFSARTQTFTPFLPFYLCHQYRHTLYSGSHVLIMFCQHLGSVSLCCGHAVISHYTDHPVIILFTHCWKEGRALGGAHCLTCYVVTICLPFFFSFFFGEGLCLWFTLSPSYCIIFLILKWILDSGVLKVCFSTVNSRAGLLCTGLTTPTFHLNAV